MRSIGYEKAAFLGGDGLFVVTDVALSYRQSARLDDQLSVSALVHSVAAATITFGQAVYRDGCCLAEGTVTIALVAADTGRPKRLPNTLRATLVSELNKE
jgi:Predicted thioesterase